MERPQPLGTEPQFCPSGQEVIGVQPHSPTTPPPPQVSKPVQVPQLTVPPQPSGWVPHSGGSIKPVHAVFGVQPHIPGVPVTPPPQVSGARQVPQLIVPPQPSDCVSQS